MPQNKNSYVAPPITQHFITITDPRLEHNKEHKLIDIIMVSICGVIAGCDSWVEIEDFGKDRQDWFATFLELPSGIPSHDTFGRVFALINPKEFQSSFASWMQSVVATTKGQVIAIDGKTSRRTFGGKTQGGFSKALHLVSAFATANGVSLGQVATDQKSNEITAIPELLKLLDMKGCLITTDAMGCQGDIAADIVGRGGDYLLAVKGNQGNLYKDIKTVFADPTVPRDVNVTEDKGHGRIDKRTCEVITGPAVFDSIRHNNNWVGLHTLVKVTAERTATSTGETHQSTESRYYICSDEEPTAKRLQQAVREHWGVENNLHWTIDMAFREDESRIRTGNAPSNMAVLRHIALNLIRQDKDRKVGIAISRHKAGRSTDYLEKLLGW
jgi:predicted transposase YbfD/YdcC